MEELSQDAIKELFDGGKIWGLSTSLDLRGCEPSLIRSKEKIQEFVIKLCKEIDMKRYGDCEIVHFGEDEKVAGYSMKQFIETSMISAHFANLTNRAYIDVFSCKCYDPVAVQEFAKTFFQAEDVSTSVLMRS